MRSREMIKPLTVLLVVMSIVPVAWGAQWVRYEAETAALSGGPTAAADATASGGQYVKMNSAGQIDFTVTAPIANVYLMRVSGKGSSSASKNFETIYVNGVEQINQQYAAGYFWDPATTNNYTSPGERDMFYAFKAAISTYGNASDPWQVSERWWEHQGIEPLYRNTPMEVMLNAGTNTITIKKNWGGSKWDYIEIDTNYPYSPVAVTYTANTEQDRAAISPYIYGSSLRFDVLDDCLTIMRFGGNHTTPYNWENNCFNAGLDWYHNSSRIGSSVVPGAAIAEHVDKARARGQESLITLPMAGYVAADAAGIVEESQAAPSTRWKPTVYRKGAPFCTPAGSPDINDNAVYSDEFINFLVSRYGNASTPNGVKHYALCNEPRLWNSTHVRIHQAVITGGELIDRSTRLASAVKDVDPYAKIFGPVFYGIWPMYDLQNSTDWATIKNGYSWFVDYYLDKMKQASDAYGARLVDVFDFHYYSYTKEDTSDPNAWGRMQSPRSLWDADYKSNPLLPRIQASIDTYNPGTRIAITEYAFGGDNHISGGIATADLLGIYGKFGLYNADYWTLKTTTYYPNAAFRLYRNYDGSKSVYGDTKISAQPSDKVNSSYYASTFASNGDQVDMIVLNKNLTRPITGTFHVTSPRTFTFGRVWAFDNTSPAITERTPIASISGNSFTYTIPPLTACHLVLVTDQAPPTAVTNLTASVISGQAILNWASNPEPDIAGYRIYRSANGTDYTQIGGQIAAAPFSDAGIAMNVTYHYKVCAVDQFTHEGPASNAATAMWIPQPALPAIYEAETALIHEAAVASGHSGYSGTGYVDYGGTGNYIEWTVPMGIAEQYSLEFRYANGSSNRPLEIRVNGEIAAASLAFNGTGGWATWGMTNPLLVQLNAGINTVRATAVDSSGANVDYLKVSSAFTNTPPTWNTNPVSESDAVEGFACDSTLADDVTDNDSSVLVFSKISGPAWLSVAFNGRLSGTPTQADVGPGTWTVSVSDGIAPAVQATLKITTYAAGDFNQNGCINLADFAVFASQWQQAVSCTGTDCPDFSQNAAVDLADFVVLAENWLYGNCH